jgi:uncharacterized membrane protein
MRSLLPCALLGCAAGMRTFMPVTAAAWRLRAHARPTRVLTVVAIGEFAFDKLPQAPSRLDPSGRVARVVTSGIAGASLAGPPGAAAATLTAMVMTPVAYRARRRLGRGGDRPDWLVGAAEDLLAVGVAAGAARLA